MNKNTVATVAVVLIALCLVGVVVGRNYISIGDDKTTTTATQAVETTIDEDGNVIFLTAPDGYTSPSSKSSMIYHGSTKLTTSTKESTEKTEKTEKTETSETTQTTTKVTKPSETRIEYVTDEIGNVVLDENGKPMTTVVVITTKPTTTDSTTVPASSENTDTTATTASTASSTDTTDTTTAQSTTQTDTNPVQSGGLNEPPPA